VKIVRSIKGVVVLSSKRMVNGASPSPDRTGDALGS
jgi:hypothetical protein